MKRALAHCTVLLLLLLCWVSAVVVLEKLSDSRLYSHKSTYKKVEKKPPESAKVKVISVADNPENCILRSVKFNGGVCGSLTERIGTEYYCTKPPCDYDVHNFTCFSHPVIDLLKWCLFLGQTHT